jgi:hypothetical protein
MFGKRQVAILISASSVVVARAEFGWPVEAMNR